MNKTQQDEAPGVSANIVRIELDALQVFDAVMAERNMAQAARRLAMTPSAVSHTVARLRQLFNDVLFIRAPGGIRPTPRAMELWQQVAEPLESLRASIGSQDFNPATDPFSVSLAMNDMLSQLVLPRLYKSLSRSAPNAKLAIKQRHTIENELAILKGSLDFAIAVVSSPILQQLQARRLWEDHYAGVCAASHPLKSQRCDFATVDAWPRIAVSPDGATLSGAELAMRGMGSRGSDAFVVSTFSCVPDLLLQSDAIALMPARYVAKVVASNPGLSSFKPDFALPTLAYDLIWHERSDRRASHRWARELIEKTCALFSRGQEP